MSNTEVESNIMSPYELTTELPKLSTHCFICTLLIPPVPQSILKQIIDIFLSLNDTDLKKKKGSTKSLSHLIIPYYQTHCQFQLP